MDIKKLIEKVKEIKIPFKKRLFFLGILTQELEKFNIKPILVGGNAVEFYTLGSYSTEDIDIVCFEREKVDEILREMNFEKIGRLWFNIELEIAIEIPDDKLSGDYNKVNIVEIEGLKIYIIGIEDLIVDRLNSCVHWNFKDDCEWAKELIMLHKNEIDFNYLEKRTKEEGTFDKLKEILNEIYKI